MFKIKQYSIKNNSYDQGIIICESIYDRMKRHRGGAKLRHIRNRDYFFVVSFPFGPGHCYLSRPFFLNSNFMGTISKGSSPLILFARYRSYEKWIPFGSRTKKTNVGGLTDVWVT